MNTTKQNINIIHDGYIQPTIKPEDYIFGDTQAPDEILQQDGQWTDFLPDEEVQIKQYDVFNCTGFATTSILEIQLRKRNIHTNYSDRALGIFAGTFPPGNNPHSVVEASRKKGLVPEKLLPFSDDLETVEQYYSFKGGDKKLCEKTGLEWINNFILNHDWVVIGSRPASAETLKQALKRSPLGIAVLGWAERDGKYFRPDGSDSHWTVLVGYKDNDYWLVFDSYPPFVKKLEWNFPIFTAKRYFIRPKTEQEKHDDYQNLSLWAKILEAAVKLFQSFIAMNKQSHSIIIPDESVPPPIIHQEPETKPKLSRINEWAEAIEDFENAPQEWNNPGAIKSLNGNFLKFKTYHEGFEYLCGYLRRVCTGKHRAYPKGGETTLSEFQQIYSPSSDKNKPDIYVNFVADRLGVATDIKIKELL